MTPPTGGNYGVTKLQDPIRKWARVRMWTCAGDPMDQMVTGPGSDVELTPM